jgi:predicted nucleic acid-binding protein
LTSDPLNIILLDTDVFSYLMEQGDPRGQPYFRHVEGRTTAISFITVGEGLFGAFWRGWGERRTAELKRRLEAAFILPPDHETSLAYGRLKSGLRRQGRVLALPCFPKRNENITVLFDATSPAYSREFRCAPFPLGLYLIHGSYPHTAG